MFAKKGGRALVVGSPLLAALALEAPPTAAPRSLVAASHTHLPPLPDSGLPKNLLRASCGLERRAVEMWRIPERRGKRVDQTRIRRDAETVAADVRKVTSMRLGAGREGPCHLRIGESMAGIVVAVALLPGPLPAATSFRWPSKGPTTRSPFHRLLFQAAYRQSAHSDALFSLTDRNRRQRWWLVPVQHR